MKRKLSGVGNRGSAERQGICTPKDGMGWDGMEIFGLALVCCPVMVEREATINAKERTTWLSIRRPTDLITYQVTLVDLLLVGTPRPGWLAWSVYPPGNHTLSLGDGKSYRIESQLALECHVGNWFSSYSNEVEKKIKTQDKIYESIH